MHMKRRSLIMLLFASVLVVLCVSPAFATKQALVVEYQQRYGVQSDISTHDAFTGVPTYSQAMNAVWAPNAESGWKVYPVLCSSPYSYYVYRSQYGGSYEVGYPELSIQPWNYTRNYWIHKIDFASTTNIWAVYVSGTWRSWSYAVLNGPGQVFGGGKTTSDNSNIRGGQNNLRYLNNTTGMWAYFYAADSYVSQTSPLQIYMLSSNYRFTVKNINY
jgi:hypothetical protein